MSRLILDTKEFVRVDNMSIYNRNYYRHIEHNYMILESCDELNNSYSFHLVDGENETFLGESRDNFTEEEIIMNFKTQYT